MGDDRPRQRELTGVSVTSIYDLCPTAPRPPARAANRGPPRLGDCLARPAPAADRVWADRLARRCRGGGPARRAVACGILHSVVLAPAHVAAFVAGRSTPGPTPLRCSLMAVSGSRVRRGAFPNLYRRWRCSRSQTISWARSPAVRVA